ncbi:MAG: nicotinate (nicotinamide) nucleotide adenylyltransferase [Clostridia bacterium]
MKIGIFGGTFNPPHLGHKNILETSIEKLNLDLVLVIPNNIPPHKEIPKNSPTTKNRFEMCEIMCDEIEKTMVSSIEIKNGGTSYMVETLEKLRKKYPFDEFFLIIGTDSFDIFEKWYRFESIFKLSTLVVLERNHLNQNLVQKEKLAEKYNAKILLLESEIIEISSTEIRKDENLHLLQPKILEYIEKNNLYKE